MSHTDNRPYAAFDIDGTVIRWQLYHAIGDAMAKRGIISADAFDTVRSARMDWKRRQDSFRAYENQLIGAFDEALAGLEVAVFDDVVNEVFDEYKQQAYTYTRNLIQELKAKNYLLFAISGSPAAIVQKISEHYGFDDFAATNYPTQTGRYTGAKDLSLGKKVELLRQLIAKHDAGSENSIAVGDSEGDIDMLKTVARPIAFNPSQKLFEHAKQRGWEVVLERKNMVYKLEPSNGSYLLA